MNVPTTADQAAEMLRLLRRIDAQLSAMPTVLAAAVQKPPRQLSDADRRVLLPIAVTLIGDASEVQFVAGQALIDAADAICPPRAALDLLGSNAQSASKKFGRLLARAEGVVIGNVVVQRVGPNRGSSLWKLLRVSGGF